MGGLLCGLCCAAALTAQELPVARFAADDTLHFQLYFKWGLLMPKAGKATLAVLPSTYREQPAWNYNLTFRTTGLFEKVFRMRDTLDCYFTKEEGRLLFATKHSDEGDYYSVDDLHFTYREENTTVHSRRYTLTRTKIDTLLVAEGRVYDMLAATMYLRALAWDELTLGKEYPFQVAIGRDLVNSAFRYAGQQIVEYKGKTYRTHRFDIDVYDEAFTQSKAAGEVWIDDDSNRVPVKIRAKLKIGAAEAYRIEEHTAQ